MRSKVTTQAGLDFEPSHLALTNRYYAKYEAISSILDEVPGILERLHQELEVPLDQAAGRGKRKGAEYRYSSDNVLRILLCQVIEGESLRSIVVRIDDSHFLRRFVRIDNGPMMDFTTLCKLKNAIRPETWHAVNRLLAKHAVARQLIGGEALRLDTTAVESNIRWPTDSSLLWDTYRVLARLIDQARAMAPEVVGTRRLQRRRAKRLQVRVSRKAAKRGRSVSALKPQYRQLIRLVEDISAWAGSVRDQLTRRSKGQRRSFDKAVAEALVEEIERYVQLGRGVVEQARRRVLEEKTVPNDEKTFSIFESHTELLKRGKAGKDVEFGHMVQIQQIREKFITDYAVFEKRPVEYTLLDPALDSHKKLFGRYPEQLAADKGYYESTPALDRLRKKVPMVSIAKKGRRTAEETERERDPLFRHAQCFRAGVEGTISFLKRVLRLWRCFNKGWRHFVATVGQTVLAHNLLILARC